MTDAFENSKKTPRSPPNSNTGDPQETEKCATCHQPESGQMVQCDECSEWHHFNCAGVGDSIADRDFLCFKCKPTTAFTGIQLSRAESISSLKSTSSSRAKTLLLLEKLEEERKSEKAYIEKKYQILLADDHDDDDINVDKQVPNLSNEIFNVVSNCNNNSNVNGLLTSSSIPVSVSVVAPINTSNQVPYLNSSLPGRVSKIPEDFDRPYNLSAPCYTVSSSRQISDINPPVYPSTRVDYVGADNNAGPLRSHEVRFQSCLSSSQLAAGQAISKDLPVFNAPCYTVSSSRQISDTNPPVYPSTRVDHVGADNNARPLRSHEVRFQPCLSSSQLAARQAISKDLPIFNGHPNEWALFLSNFESSTRICGFSNEENLVRLQRCLKGKALEAVRHRLLLPDSVPQVIETLRLLFGRPEIIINSLLKTIRDFPPPRFDKLETFINYSLVVQNLCDTVVASGLISHLNNPSLLQELVDKLPAQNKLSWALYKKCVCEPNISTFGSWLHEIARAASDVSIQEISVFTNSDNKRTNRGSLNFHDQSTFQSNNYQCKPVGVKICIVCNKVSHNIESCKKFINSSHTERWSLVRQHSLCRKCLCRHNQFTCKISKVCGKNDCKFLHHPLLHNYAKDNEAKSSHASNTHREHNYSTLFRVVPVKIYGKGKLINCFAFLDEGSSVTLIENSLVNELDISGAKEELCLMWTANTTRSEPNSMRLSLEISGSYDKAAKYKLHDVRTVDKLCLSEQTVNVGQLQKMYSHLRGIPVASYERMIPRILIGLDNWYVGIPLRICEGKAGEPVATKTRLGWEIHGRCSIPEVESDNKLQTNNFHRCDCKADIELNDLLKQYFSIDSIGVKIPNSLPESEENRRAVKILETTTRKVGKRYEVGLLWKSDDISLPNSLPMAHRRLQCLEKQMSSNQDMRTSIEKTILDYLDKGYIRELSHQELSLNHPRIWYLPIFTVVNPNKPTKRRIVWDAAAEVEGVSLNSVLLKGPDELVPLIHIIYQFREHLIGLTGDIREMFHQVTVRKDDQHSQRFLWRNADGSIITLVVQVMTFGAASSPCAAQYVKNHNAKTFESQYPEASRAIEKNHYVDDLLISVDTITEAVSLAKEIKFIHEQGGFEIRNFRSNSEVVIRQIDDCSRPANALKVMNLQKDVHSGKVLGMLWDDEYDVFQFPLTLGKVNKEIIVGQRRPTKREVLRTIMSLFDPVGLISPFSVCGKIILREIWRACLDWDDLITDDIFSSWKMYIAGFQAISTITIPRCYTIVEHKYHGSVQLHLFVDASESAMAAAAYFRIETNKGVLCSLVHAKTKTAPQTPMSIPRLELQAAVIGARLATLVRNGHNMRIDQQFLWTDSKTVWSWIRSEPRKYRQFVAFRIAEILEHTSVSEWRWVPTKKNVADKATKWGSCGLNLESKDEWFTGPPFLMLPENDWPKVPTSQEKEHTEELRPRLHCYITLQANDLFDLSRFSSWPRLLRTAAFVLRFLNNLQKGVKSLSGPISPQEYEKAETILFRVAQQAHFGDEIATLKRNQIVRVEQQHAIDKGSPIYKCSPYLDNANVLRIKGRIDNAAAVGHDTKRPIILPKQHQVTKLVVSHFHQRFHHQNHETVVNEIRQKFYIPALRAIVKSVKSSCQKCKILTATPHPPEMAILPEARMAAFTRPFTFTGIDYFGPILVSVGRRREKRWGVIFTCLTVRAIHIEVAHSLSTDSCILALRNFAARRGMPKEIYSDNGTNFRGANEELKREIKNIDLYELQEKGSVGTRLKWNFNPPAAPHMGGCWERLIRSVKSTLGVILQSNCPSDEILKSVLAEAEYIVNSRPLTYIPVDCDTPEALTPNHFLLGTSNGGKPEGCLSDDPTVLRNNWKQSQYLTNLFWKRWVREYLPDLTRRTKWFKQTKPIKTGDLVLIIDENLPRNTWKRGVVVETTNTRSGQIRQARVQTNTGILTRPAVKLALLDVLGENEQNQRTD